MLELGVTPFNTSLLLVDNILNTTRKDRRNIDFVLEDGGDAQVKSLEWKEYTEALKSE